MQHAAAAEQQGFTFLSESLSRTARFSAAIITM
jgi:hypothetical protein